MLYGPGNLKNFSAGHPPGHIDPGETFILMAL